MKRTHAFRSQKPWKQTFLRKETSKSLQPRILECVICYQQMQQGSCNSYTGFRFHSSFDRLKQANVMPDDYCSCESIFSTPAANP
ncbi:hypothetical protein J6590_082987 [Homalodisca vitripennis]|nr:hypothetical protein J6590_082987 [Homalodisca vitripennis]